MMQKLIIAVMLCISGFAQQMPLRLPGQIEKFANYLFNEQDYLRASEQYQLLLTVKSNDTINLRLAKCYIKLDTLELADVYLAKISHGSLAARGVADRYRYLFNNGRYKEIISGFETHKGLSAFTTHFIHPLYHAICWRERLTRPDDSTALELFPLKERDSVAYYHQELLNTEKKNPLTAAILSAILPGAGKFYTGNYGDGTMAMVTTGLFAYLSVYNIQHHHTAKAYIFTTLGSLYYAANIYGAAASAQIYNAQYLLNVQIRFDSFISNRNCFLRGSGIEELK
jgi:TM2 domain-containing membrane protein YozV